MLNLTNTSTKVQLITGSTGTINVEWSAVDAASGPTFTPVGSVIATISTATTTDIVAAPAASTQRNVKFIAIHNNHASTSNAVTVQITDGTNITHLWQGTLLAQEFVVFDDGEWVFYAATGVVKVTTDSPVTTKGDIFTFGTAIARLPVGSDGQVLAAASADATGLRWVSPMLNNRSTSTVSAGYAADTYLAGSAINMPTGMPVVGTTYHLMFDMVKTAAGTATFVATVRYGTAGTTSDAAILTFTFTAGTAAADTGTFELWLHFRTVGSSTSAVVVGTIQCRHHLAATGLTTLGAAGMGQITTVSSGFSSTPAGSILGVSINGGASFSGTNTIVEAQAYNLNV